MHRGCYPFENDFAFCHCGILMLACRWAAANPCCSPLQIESVSASI